MARGTELLSASDETIDDAVRYADPMVLRGLLYQLTGDERVAATKVSPLPDGELMAVADPADVELLRAEAAAFLKSHRDQGAPAIPCGSRERLLRSLGLTIGRELPACELDMWEEQLALDPWARSLVWRKRPAAEDLRRFRVAVIGAGMGGLNAAVQLKRAGIDYFVIEKNADVGGTWYENRYPGARVDSTSRTYTHLYGVDFGYPNAFCPQRENLRYFNWVADHFELRPSITFETEVKSIVWNEATGRWDIRAEGPDGTRSWQANAVIASVGFLSRPQLPTIDGMDDFEGPAFHTARWPRDLDLTGKRVAVIGTGATGYQMVPELAKQAAHTLVFQRTPNWCFDVPGYLSPFPPQVNWLDRNFPYMTNFIRFRLGWLAGPDNARQVFHVDPAFSDPHARSARNRKVREQRIAFIRKKLTSRPDLIDKMIPEAPPYSARPIIVDENDCIYDALLRDDVSLVTEPIRRIGRNAIEVEGGVEHPVDVVVFATGYKANDFLWPMEIRGRGGRSIEQLWEKDGARAYLGTMLPGFPNFFMIYGPNTNAFSGLQIVDFEEMVTRFSLACIAELVAGKKKTIDVTPEAYERYNAELDRDESRMIYKDPRAHNYYTNRSGRSAVNCPVDIRKIWTWLRDPANAPAAGAGVEVPGDPEAIASRTVRPYFGEDLVLE